MKLSRTWLQQYFEQPLPDAQKLADALTFHAFEIESVENDVLDVKVTPNRGHDCLCHRGIAKEVSAILNVPMKFDPLREPAPLEPRTDIVRVEVKEPSLCPRFTAAFIRDLHVGPSPEWLRKALESLGQRSINNVVDATNFVMFDIGQPLHAFDAGELSERDGTYALSVEKAKEAERLIALDGKEYSLSDSMLIIRDGHTALPVSIAGIKGGAPAAITETTEAIVLEAANWNGVTIRRTSPALKLRTDASQRFEQVLSPELAAYGTRAAAKLILELAGGELVGYIDEYPMRQPKREVSVSLEKVNRVLGTDLHEHDVEDAFGRLQFAYEKNGSRYAVFVPFERLDLAIPEDLVEEVARIIGYEKVPSVPLPAFPAKTEISAVFSAAERERKDLLEKGYSEVVTSVFADAGDRVVANKVDGIRPYLRRTLLDGLRESYERNVRNKDLLGLKSVRIFEIGTVWQKGNEVTMLGTADEKGVRERPLDIRSAPQQYERLPTSQATRYQPFSKYPFIVRDISIWVPDTDEARGQVITIFAEHGGGLLRHVVIFDQYKKDGRNSLSFRLVFQSFDRTLTDFEANERMQSITNAIQGKGWEVR